MSVAFKDKNNSLELQTPTQGWEQTNKSLISQLPSGRSTRVVQTDKGRIDVVCDTRVAAVHIMSFSRGCAERALCHKVQSADVLSAPVGR